MQQAHEAAGVIFGWDPMMLSSIILVISYAAIMSERINRAIAALLGAGLMIFMGVVNQELAIAGIDFNTIFLLTGMMMIVSITKRSGVFQFVAIMAAQAVRANPRLLLMALAVITAVFSAFLDNVTTVMLVVPITLLLTEQLKVKAYPFLFTQIFASNIGGTSTLIGDPPNILIGSAAHLSFMDFVCNLTPAILIIMVAMTVVFDLIWGRSMKATLRARATVMRFNPHEAIEDYPLLWKSLCVLAIVIVGFIAGHDLGWQPGSIALTGAALLVLLDIYKFGPEEQSHKVHGVFQDVEWITIFFFIGLFVIVGGVEHAGVLKWMAEGILSVTGDNVPMAGILILWSSAILSAIVDNIPFVATMIPLIHSMAPALGGEAAIQPLWWCLSLGACLGGNGTLIGASANVMVASFAERAGQRISFMQFMKLAFPLMILTILMSTVYVWVVYFSS